jgi:hypothetical protein
MFFQISNAAMLMTRSPAFATPKIMFLAMWTLNDSAHQITIRATAREQAIDRK